MLFSWAESPLTTMISQARSRRLPWSVSRSRRALEAPGVHQIWVDPGSFTSCYGVYRFANRYLIFGTLLPAFPQTTTVMTILPGSSGKTKPLPPDFNPAAPPPIYYSPERAGSRSADSSPGFEQDLAMLRAYRAGVPPPRVLGHVHLSPFLGWPYLDGPPLAGAEITISNGAVNLRTTADEMGRFWLRDAPAGDYAVRADLPPYQMNPEPVRFWTTESVNGSLHVPDTGCGYTEVEFATTSRIQGVVLDPRGKGAAKILVRLRKKEGPPGLHQLFAITDKQGRFTISGVPDGDVYLLAGVDPDLLAGGTNVDMDMRYRTVYYPSGSFAESASPLRLRPGEMRDGLVLRLGAPLRWNRVKVKVLDRDGRPDVRADVDMYGGPPGPGHTKTGVGGIGRLSCLSGWKYELEAAAGRSQPDGKSEVLVTSRRPFICGDQVSPVVLELNHTMRGIIAGQIVDAKGIALAYPIGPCLPEI
jgi:hypothetical protein